MNLKNFKNIEFLSKLVLLRHLRKILFISWFCMIPLFSNHIIALGSGYSYLRYTDKLENSEINIPPIALIYEYSIINYFSIGVDLSLAKYGNEYLYMTKIRLIGLVPLLNLYGGITAGIYGLSDSQEFNIKIDLAYSVVLGYRFYIVPNLFFVFLEGAYPYPNVLLGIGFDF